MLEIRCLMYKGNIEWEYFDDLQGELHIPLHPKEAIKLVKFHQLEITKRELENDTLILTYS